MGLLTLAFHELLLQLQQVALAFLEVPRRVASVDAKGFAVSVDQAECPNRHAFFECHSGQDDAAAAHNDVLAEEHVGMRYAGVFAGHGGVGHGGAGVVVVTGVDGDSRRDIAEIIERYFSGTDQGRVNGDVHMLADADAAYTSGQYAKVVNADAAVKRGSIRNLNVVTHGRKAHALNGFAAQHRHLRRPE